MTFAHHVLRIFEIYGAELEETVAIRRQAEQKAAC